MLTKVIESSQHKVEQMHFDIRKQLLAYDNVMNRQREAVYAERHTILQEEDIVDYGWGIIQGVLEDILDRYFPEQDEPDPERAASRVRAVFGAGSDEIIAPLDSRAGMEALRGEIIESMKRRYAKKILDFTPDVARVLLRDVVLVTLDDAWRNHLLGMDELRRGIGLRAIGQKDPLLEYQFESYNLFQEMMTQVRESFVEQFFRVRLISDDRKHRERKFSEGRDSPVVDQRRSGANDYADPRRGEPRYQAGEGKPEPIKKTVRIGRNDPCPCGSGKKYKHCCGKNV
jgi:preprotein translocase subunit SecA